MEFRDLFGFEPSSNWFGRILTGRRVQQCLDDLWAKASASMEVLIDILEKIGHTPEHDGGKSFFEPRTRYEEAIRIAKKAGYKVKEESLFRKEDRRRKVFPWD